MEEVCRHTPDETVSSGLILNTERNLTNSEEELV
jgi:hypothetical protein